MQIFKPSNLSIDDIKIRKDFWLLYAAADILFSPKAEIVADRTWKTVAEKTFVQTAKPRRISMYINTLRQEYEAESIILSEYRRCSC
jgi:hypothetical protein